MRPLTELSDKELQILIENHKKKDATHLPSYVSVLNEIHRRNDNRLDLKRSIAYLKTKAAQNEFVTYGELAEANGCSWNEVRYPMNTHLWVLVEHAKLQGLPMLSAMIVNKAGKANGKMEPETLKGFVAAAKALKYPVLDELEFLERHQLACFAWGKDEPWSL